MSSNSALFPKKARTLPEQVDVHHELLNRHGKEFMNHADWITGVHQRVAELEKNGGHGNGNGVLKVVWVFGILWTLIGVVVLLVVLLK